MSKEKFTYDVTLKLTDIITISKNIKLHDEETVSKVFLEMLTESLPSFH